MKETKEDRRQDTLCCLFTRSSRPSTIRESVETWNLFWQAKLVSRTAQKTLNQIQRKRKKI